MTLTAAKLFDLIFPVVAVGCSVADEQVMNALMLFTTAHEFILLAISFCK